MSQSAKNPIARVGQWMRTDHNDKGDLETSVVCHGMSFKQYDHYLQFRMTLSQADARRRALEDNR